VTICPGVNLCFSTVWGDLSMAGGEASSLRR
jgi:hypothetical protein